MAIYICLLLCTEPLQGFTETNASQLLKIAGKNVGVFFT